MSSSPAELVHIDSKNVSTSHLPGKFFTFIIFLSLIFLSSAAEPAQSGLEMIASKEESEKKRAALDFFETVPLPVTTYNYAIDEVSGGPQLQLSPHDTTAQQQAQSTSIAYKEDSKAKLAALEFFGSIPIPDTNFGDIKLSGETRLEQSLGITDTAPQPIQSAVGQNQKSGVTKADRPASEQDIYMILMSLRWFTAKQLMCMMVVVSLPAA